MTRPGAAARAVAALAILGSGVLAFAVPAAAANGDSVTVNKAASVTTRNSQPLSIAASATGHCSGGKSLTRAVTLSLVGPAGPNSTTTVLKSLHRPCQQDVSLTDTIGPPARNGGYQVILQNGGGAAQTTTADVEVLIPPAKPKHLNVRTDSTVASFTWTANAEPDVTAYQIATTQGYVATTVKPKRSCSGSSCAAAVNMGERYMGSTVNFVIRAERCGRSCGHPVVGPDSQPVAASFAGSPPPPPSPSPSPISTPPGQAAPPPGSTGSSGAGNGTGSAPGPAGIAGSGHHRHHPAAGAHSPASQPLPPVPAASTQPRIGISAPPPPSATTVTAKTSRSTLHAVARDLSRALKAEPVWRGIAAAVVLLLIGVHLRTWSRRLTPT
jgi:hypothetical protein